jgi:hypothetical protein
MPCGMEGRTMSSRNEAGIEAERSRTRSGSISTVFECAFLTALLRLAPRQTRAESIMLPAGEVNARELRRVVVALLCGRDERRDAA